MPCALLSDWPVILGNADDFLLEVRTDTNEEISDEQLERRLWSREQIRGFQPTHERDGLLAFHGPPRNFEDISVPETEDDSLRRVDVYELPAGGHTHTQWARRLGDALYVNPGAVRSQPAEFAIVIDRAVEFRHCAY